MAGARGSVGDAAAALGTEEALAIEEDGDRDEELVTAVAGFVNLVERHWHCLEDDALGPAQVFELLGNAVGLLIEHHSLGAILGKKPLVGIPGQVLALGIEDEDLDVGSLAKMTGR